MEAGSENEEDEFVMVRRLMRLLEWRLIITIDLAVVVKALNMSSIVLFMARIDGVKMLKLPLIDR